MNDELQKAPEAVRELIKVLKDTVQPDGSLTFNPRMTKLFFTWMDSIAVDIEAKVCALDSMERVLNQLGVKTRMISGAMEQPGAKQ